ncbi:MAG: hypothetical protein PHF14_13610 [Verrucomicrobiota bacterium]|jgi:hypothetical protein|nr:hypothetical protein [Verrucomicrobiota bacterium]MDD8050823.1 hypothetical protein [Verrucomicrobiota bacterium]
MRESIQITTSMRPIRVACLLTAVWMGGVFGLVHAQTSGSQQLRTVTTASGIFRVTADTPDTAVRAGLEADRFLERFSALTGALIDGRVPMRIMILKVDHPDGQYRGLVHEYVNGALNLELRMGCYQEVPQYAFQVGLVQLFLCRMVYPEQSGFESRLVELPPAWIVLGISTLLDPSLAGHIRPTLPAVAVGGEGGGILRVHEILGAPAPAQGAELSVFSAYSGLLVRSLMALPGGTEHLHRWLRAWAVDRRSSPEALFWRVYGPLFQTPEDLEKWWLLQVSRTEDRVGPGSLTYIETMRRLDELLPTPVSDLPKMRGVGPVPTGQTTLTLEELWDFKRHPRYGQLVLAKRYGLISLFVKANRGAAPVLDAYLKALDAMLETSQSRFLQQLAIADALREDAERKMGSIAMQLDDLEANSPVGAGRREQGLNEILQGIHDRSEGATPAEGPIPPPRQRVKSYIDQLEEWADILR